MARLRAFIKNVLAFALGTLLALLLVEGVLRVYNPFETRVRGDRIVLPAGKRYAFNNPAIPGLDPRIVHTKNSLGFRGPEPPPAGLEAVLSVVTVGGSTTECFYLSDGRDWPAVLQDSLRTRFPDAWVNNAGLDGHSTYGHAILVDDYLAGLRPRYTLFLVGLNDVGRENFAQTAAQVKGRVQWGSLEGFVKSLAAYSEAASLGLNGYRYLRARMLGLPHQAVDVENLPLVETDELDPASLLAPHQERYLPAYRSRLQALVRRTRAAGLTPILITQPALYGPGIDPSTGVDLGRILVGGASGAAGWTVLEAYNQVTRDVGAEESLLVIDLAHLLERDSRYYYDFVHFNNEGAARVAALIYQPLAAYLASV